MTLETINKIITSSELVAAVVIIAFVLVFTIFRKSADRMQKSSRSSHGK